MNTQPPSWLASVLLGVMPVLAVVPLLMAPSCEETVVMHGHVPKALDTVIVEGYSPRDDRWRTLGASATHPESAYHSTPWLYDNANQYSVAFKLGTTGMEMAGKRGLAAKVRLYQPVSGVYAICGPGGSLDCKWSGEGYACSDNFVQRYGRRMCDDRAVTWWDGVGDNTRTSFGYVDYTRSRHLLRPAPPLHWQGDSHSRLVLMKETPSELYHLADTLSTQFPHGLAELHINGSEQWEVPWPDDGAEKVDLSKGNYGHVEYARSVDIGACSVTLPWEWDPNHPDAEVARSVLGKDEGTHVRGRGIADVVLEEFAEASKDFPDRTKEDNAFWFYDAVSHLESRVETNPTQFFTRFNENADEDRVCVRSYWDVDGKVQWRPGVDVTVTGAFAGIATLLQLGQCRNDRAMAVQFCGKFDVDDDGAPTFVVDRDVGVEIDRWRDIRKICNNQVRPRIADGVKEAVLATVGEKFTAKLKGLTEDFPVQIRRFEMTPTGLVAVLAETSADPQFALLTSEAAEEYGLTDPGLVCRPDHELYPAPRWKHKAHPPVKRVPKFGGIYK